ncbi:DUF6765 family protein [Oceanospirillum sediminis]|uniref:Uncharacterized protein n=1 Tax=Oceanospirillum sediminis TaxID=2760088 RepID=A0A839IW64_9GAMM|nr:DUF6765 family protein [Oceanospirillum sediminis]MBB1489211.1 hypothetical protein [Oceanospirillum sediminis]
MDTDFHFFGTGTAAAHGGFSSDEATLIANAAEFVDFFDSSYWSYWRLKEGSESRLRIDYPHLSCQTIDWKMVADYDENIWNAFHFPPGNKPHREKEKLQDYLGGVPVPDWVDDFKHQHLCRNTRLAAEVEPFLCRPFSPFALHMALDTINKYRAISQADQHQLKELLKKYLGAVPHLAPSDAKSLALVFLGIRMHVLADTWAHQDFSGIASKDINAAGTFNDVYASKEFPYVLEDTTWKGTLWALGSDTDCSAAPDVPGDAACRGHGQMGHYPDYSWLNFVYPASWLKQGHYLVRNNPEQYKQAWYWLSTVMASCREDINTRQDLNLKPAPSIPADITRSITSYHKLDSSKLSAVAESERVWQDTLLAGDLDLKKRWNHKANVFDDSMRQNLGVIGELPTTRLGTVDIRAGSTLHLMELASALHYQWCLEWAGKHPDFYWRPVAKGG